MDERPVDVVQPDLTMALLTAIADHKVHAVWQRRNSRHEICSKLTVVSRPPSSIHLHAAATCTADEARSARQHCHAIDVACVRLVDGALAHAVAPHLEGAIPRAGDDAAVGRHRKGVHRRGARRASQPRQRTAAT